MVRKPLPASDELTLKGVRGDAGFRRSSMLKELRYFCLLWYAEEAATGWSQLQLRTETLAGASCQNGR